MDFLGPNQAHVLCGDLNAPMCIMILLSIKEIETNELKGSSYDLQDRNQVG